MHNLKGFFLLGNKKKAGKTIIPALLWVTTPPKGDVQTAPPE
jgi:hypothetical protein